MEIHLVPAFSDNYIFLLRDPAGGPDGRDAIAVVDPGDAKPVIAALDARGWTLTHILNTHHHADHIGGNRDLKERYGATLVAARADAARISDMDIAVGENDRVSFGSQTATVLFVPGHTAAHIAYWFPDAKAVFCGDTLFALGCGRLFEGTPAQMWDSLLKLRALPDDTAVYCAHEYTLSNARFAVTIESGNADLLARADAIKATRERGEPTVPSTIGLEKRTNPFLRADVPAVQAAVGLAGTDPVEVFAEIRRRKDQF